MITGNDCYLKYGFPDDDKKTTVDEKTVFEKKWMGMYDIPALINLAIPCIPNKVYCNVDLCIPLTNALTKVVERGLQDQIKTWDGCYNLRPIRAYEKQYATLIKDGKPIEALKFLSIHSWGVAIDINAAWNGLGKVPTMSKELVACFEESGFEWGGKWKRLDGMHFQIRNIPVTIVS